jgi:hypothetical protein
MKDDLGALIYKAIEKASTCWTIRPLGDFDHKYAGAIAEELLSDIKERYPLIEQEEVPERDIHFEGFASLIFLEIQEMAISYKKFPGAIAMREHECKIISQRLWDFADYTRKYFWDRYDMDQVPDRTKWPELEDGDAS